MPLYEIRVYKHSDRYGLDRYWHNRWYIDLPLHGDDIHSGLVDFTDWLVQIESEVHHHHVIFSHVTFLNPTNRADTNYPYTNTFHPYGGTARGFWGTPARPADYKYVLKVAKYVRDGRMGYWWFRGGQNLDYITTNSQGVIFDKLRGFWEGIVHAWLFQLQATWGAKLYVPQGINRYGRIVSFAEVIDMHAMGLAVSNKSWKHDGATWHAGRDIYNGLIEKSNEVDDWRWSIEVNYEYGFASYAGAWRDGSRTVLGHVISIANTAGGYLDSLAGTAPPPAGHGEFRWEPVVSACQEIVQQIQNAEPADIDTINNLPFTIDGGGNEVLQRSDFKALGDLFDKYRGFLAALMVADWLNPVNADIG